MNLTSEHFIHVEKLRDLRLLLVKTDENSRRDGILRQIEEIEDELKDRFKP